MTPVYEVFVCVCLLLIAVCAVPLDGNKDHQGTESELFAKVEDIYNEEDFQIVSKRFLLQGTPSTQSPLAWTCAQRARWRSLGEEFFPSRIREVECMSSTCWYNHYNCTSVEYSALILTACTRVFCNDHRVPSSLRDNWEFTNILVPVGCMCTR